MLKPVKPVRMGRTLAARLPRCRLQASNSHARLHARLRRWRPCQRRRCSSRDWPWPSMINPETQCWCRWWQDGVAVGQGIVYMEDRVLDMLGIMMHDYTSF